MNNQQCSVSGLILSWVGDTAAILMPKAIRPVPVVEAGGGLAGFVEHALETA